VVVVAAGASGQKAAAPVATPPPRRPAATRHVTKTAGPTRFLSRGRAGGTGDTAPKAGGTEMISQHQGRGWSPCTWVAPQAVRSDGSRSFPPNPVHRGFGPSVPVLCGACEGRCATGATLRTMH
jgi:hypothetical protein